MALAAQIQNLQPIPVPPTPPQTLFRSGPSIGGAGPDEYPDDVETIHAEVATAQIAAYVLTASISAQAITARASTMTTTAVVSAEVKTDE